MIRMALRCIQHTNVLFARRNVIGMARDTFFSPVCRDKHWPFGEYVLRLDFRKAY